MTPGPDGSGVLVTTVTEADWERFRDLRLEMLADTPTAYIETLETAQGADEAEWRFRARRSGFDGSIGVVAVERAAGDGAQGADAATGRFVGTMSAWTDPAAGDGAGRTWVVGVYVAPAHRGSGLADRLLDQLEAWARERGVRELWLEVHEDNEAAQRFYRRRGYEFTGHTRPYDLDETRSEREMRRTL